VARELAHELDSLGHDVTVAASALGDTRAIDAAEPVRVVRIPGYGFGWFRLLPFLAGAWNLAADADRIIAINVGYGGVLARLAKPRFNTPYVVPAYGYEFVKFEQRPSMAALLRWVYRGAESIPAISSFTAEALAGFGVDESRIAVVRPGARVPEPIDPGRVAAVRRRHHVDEHPYVLSVGRFIQRKGQRTLVRAWPLVLEACPNARLLLVGRGPLHGECVSKAKSLGLEGLVHCPGYVPDDDLAALYAGCACFALPTGESGGGQVEGFGLVFTEAHAHGKPVVAGRSGGVADAVIDEQTGLLVRPDDPECIADAIVRLLNDPTFAQRLGANGRERVERELNWTAFARGILSEAGVRE